MPYAIEERAVRLENVDVATAMALLSIRTEEHTMRLEEVRLADAMNARQHQRVQDAGEAVIRRLTAERQRQQSEENRQVREQEERRREQEHAKEMKRLEMEENNNAREHEFSLRGEARRTMRLKLDIESRKRDIERLKLQRLISQNEDNRHAREHKERMAAFEVERLNSAEEIRRQRHDERSILTEETQGQMNELSDRCEQLGRERRKEKEEDIRSLMTLGLVASGVGAASGAIGGVLGTTAAVGLAAGVAGAATVMAPVSGTVAILSGVGYVYKKVTSSNRA